MSIVSQYGDQQDKIAAEIEAELRAQRAAGQPVRIHDVGPIEELQLTLPPDGGVVVLRGPNGCGKSKGLEAVQSLVRGNGSLTNRDGTLRGEVEGFGARITVARSTRRSGELEVTSLEGRLDIAQLVEPPIKDPAAADARRIKALASLTGAKADPSLFYELLGGKEAFERHVAPKSIQTDDLVEMAARVKRDLEADARDLEAKADHADGNAKGLREAADGVDLDAPSDGDALQAAFEAAIREEGRLKQERESALKTRQEAEQAQRRLDTATKTRQAPTVDEAKARLEHVAGQKMRAVEQVARLKADLAEAEERSKEWAADHLRAEYALRAAESHAEIVAEWQAQVDAGRDVAIPAETAIDAASAAVKVARQAVETGSEVRRARAKLDEAKQHLAKAKQLRADAYKLRDAAKLTDEVLSQAVACAVLRVDGGRLVTTTKRGATYYGDLSQGERWKIALDIAADRVGEGGLIVVEQPAWESLDPQNRRLIAEHAKARRVVILTAEADSGELRSEVFDG